MWGGEGEVGERCVSEGPVKGVGGGGEKGVYLRGQGKGIGVGGGGRGGRKVCI